MTKLDRGIQGFINALSQILFNVFPAILYLVISVIVMFKLEWRLAVMVLYFAPLPALIATVGGPEQTRRERTLARHPVDARTRVQLEASSRPALIHLGSIVRAALKSWLKRLDVRLEVASNQSRDPMLGHLPLASADPIWSSHDNNVSVSQRRVDTRAAAGSALFRTWYV